MLHVVVEADTEKLPSTATEGSYVDVVGCVAGFSLATLLSGTLALAVKTAQITEETMPALPSKHYSGYRKATKEEDQRTPGNATWRKIRGQQE